MGSLGNTYQSHALDAIFGAGFTIPATVYVALYVFTPNPGGGGTEVSGGSYARVAVTNNITNWPNAVAGSKSNGIAVTFPTASAGWGVVSAFGIHDNPSTDSLIVWGTLATAQSVLTGDTPSFGIGALVLSAS